MHRILPFALATIILTMACDGGPQQSLTAQPSESSDPCEAITNPTRVQVLLPPGSVPLHKNAYLLTDHAAVEKLIAFINQRRNVSAPTIETMPYPSKKVTLYGGSHSIAVFGSG